MRSRLARACSLLYFLLKIIEIFGIKKILNGYVKSVADLFYGGNGSRIVSPGYDVI